MAAGDTFWQLCVVGDDGTTPTCHTIQQGAILFDSQTPGTVWDGMGLVLAAYFAGFAIAAIRRLMLGERL